MSGGVIIDGVNGVGEQAGWRAVNATSPSARWRDLPPTDAQRRTLRKLGVSDMPRTRGEASEVIRVRIAARHGERWATR